MAYRVKKFRGYRRMLRKLMRVVEEYPIPWIEGCVERALIWGYGELSPAVAEPDGAGRN